MPERLPITYVCELLGDCAAVLPTVRDRRGRAAADRADIDGRV